MDKVIYRNRYNDKVCFTHKGDHVILSGVSYTRAGFDDDNNYEWIDPAGGPYLSIGNDLGYFGEILNGFVICSIHPVEQTEDWILGGPMYEVVKKIKEYKNNKEDGEYNFHGEETTRQDRQDPFEIAPEPGEEGI